jgi:phosphoribosylformimino-5-aminoimidazole carboxamide ribotide isomerase
MPYQAGWPRIVGVIDLRHGHAVHAKGGAREAYAPVTAVAGREIRPGDARSVAGFYGELGLDEVYAADLDAIAGRPWQDEVIRTLAETIPRLWLDAAITTPGDAQRALTLGASPVVVGLETLPSFQALQAMCEAVGPERVALSLDVREGVTLTANREIASGTPAAVVAARAVDSGVRTIIVLDLARVGARRGCNLDTISLVRRAVPQVTLLAGGGVRDEDDLRHLLDAGCDGVLVATALLSGSLRPNRAPHR